MSIPVEHIGSERQRIPAVLIKIEKSMGLIKYAPRHTPLKVPLSELQLAPSAFEPFHENVYSHTEVCELGSPIKTWTDKDEQRLNPREPGEIWLTTETTSRKKPSLPESSECTAQKLEESPSSSVNSPAGAWWPGRVLNIHGGFVHVEVAAPLAESGNMDDLTTPHVVRMGSSLLPFRSTIVRLGEVRPLWTGRPAPVQSTAAGEQPKHGTSKDPFSEQYVLTTPGVLNRHTICIPAYLARLATSMDAHTALIKFCDAPCLVQCDPEPFLSHVLVKRIVADGASAAASGRQTPCQDTDSNLGVPSVAVPANSQTANAPSWPSACTIAQSPLLNPPNIAGTLSQAGVTDPTLLLEGLPGANGPLVLLHIWSGSPEAIRRAGLLELAHVRILVFRYHVVRKLSNGEPGELDLADSTDAPTENGDAPAMHCKPISIPVHQNPDDPSAAPSGMMIGYSAQFRIQPQLIGLAIGYRGATIHEARALPGVRNVDLLHDGIVHIEAETVEACQAVRNLLDFTEAEIPVSPRLASRLIGSKGMNIRKLAASAGVRRAQLLDPLMRKRRQQQQQLNRQQVAPLSDRDQFDALIDAGRNGQNADGDGVENTGRADAVEPDVRSANGESSASPAANSEDEKLPPPAFYLLGTRPAVAKMRLLLEFQADNWNELDELEETRRSLFTQLRQSNQQSTRMGSFPPTSGSDAPAQGGPGPTGRGRGRRTSGRGGSADGAPDHDQPPQQSNFPRPFRGRGRGGPVNGGPNGRPSAPTNRFNREPDGPSHPNEEHHDNMPQKPEGDDDHAVHNGWQPVPPKVGMANGSGPRGRGRNRPRNQPVNS
ncbi:Synaptic functional regulator fmr1 [Clonorchis sinensis]|uniref:Synaptic functional regulator fmr1 n=1 Tax=Clonorchis sinensis TaxID=79923 RepID=A0A8T1MX52_CLOSI|nr:Synaptic functional regulator fmr1 [Clonorchis sinensis]